MNLADFGGLGRMETVDFHWTRHSYSEWAIAVMALPVISETRKSPRGEEVVEAFR